MRQCLAGRWNHKTILNADKNVLEALIKIKERTYARHFGQWQVIAVSDLRKEEHWISELSDATLLCIANIYQCTAKVYTSIIDMPIINVVPSIKVITKNQHSELEYALLAEPGFEHYDACTHVAAYSTPVKNRPTQQEHSLNDLEHPSPRKQAHYTSPGKKKVTRKKLLSPETWKKNIRRKAHQSGKEYTNTKGETVPGRQVKPQDYSKCR